MAEGLRIKDLFTLPHMILLTNRRQSMQKYESLPVKQVTVTSCCYRSLQQKVPEFTSVNCIYMSTMLTGR